METETFPFSNCYDTQITLLAGHFALVVVVAFMLSLLQIELCQDLREHTWLGNVLLQKCKKKIASFVKKNK